MNYIKTIIFGSNDKVTNTNNKENNKENNKPQRSYDCYYTLDTVNASSQSFQYEINELWKL